MTAGLEGVVVAETVLSQVDGEQGRLVIRGHDVEALAAQASFEEACALLWEGALDALPTLPSELAAARVRAFERLGELGSALDAADGMEALRAALGHLPSSGEGDRVNVMGALAVYTAAWIRRRAGQAPIPPDPARGHAADYLHMATGQGDEAHTRALEDYLVTVCEHGMNASTFTARVVASTRSDAVSAVVAALGALKGPLHGGAPGPVLDMLDAIGSPDQAKPWLEAELAAGRRIMGMGHRVYRVRDPRVAVLEKTVERLSEAGIGQERLALARAVEESALDLLRAPYPNRTLAANVEFMTAIVLEAVGLPREAFSPTFAVARGAGWLAHVAEQVAEDRIIRPRARYVGPVPAEGSSASASS